jgi:hypothetical protein
VQITLGGSFGWKGVYVHVCTGEVNIKNIFLLKLLLKKVVPDFTAFYGRMSKPESLEPNLVKSGQRVFNAL